MKAQISALGVIVILSAFFFIFSRETSSVRNPLETLQTLDNIDQEPEWLKMMVEPILTSEKLNVWIPTGNFQLSSLVRVPRFPRRFSDQELTENAALNNFQLGVLRENDTLTLSGIRNEQISSQLAIAARKDLERVHVKVSDLRSDKGNYLSEANFKVRYVKYVPIHRSRSEYIWSARYEEVAGAGVSGLLSPNVVGDPLVEMDQVALPAYRVQPIWFTIKIPKNTPPGVYKGKISLFADSLGSYEYPLHIEVSDMVLPDPEDYVFFLDMWLNPNAIAYNHKVSPWSKSHWLLLEKYIQDLASRGCRSITAVITDEPWRKPWLNDSFRSQTFTGYESLIKWVRKKNGKWDFDYTLFDRYVEFSMKLGLNERINAYSMTSFGEQERTRYFDSDKRVYEEMVFDSVEDPEYVSAWKAFLQSFSKHLEAKGWLDQTFLCFDERPHKTMNSILQLIKNYAPEFEDKISISGRPGATHQASNFLSISYEFFPGQNLDTQETLSVIKERNADNRITTFYLCGQPAHPNTLTFSPAIESQIIPWIALKYGLSGYLRWSYCNWPKDPYYGPVHNYIQGDEYIVYPGKNGPVSSIRWELMKEGIEDYEMFRKLESLGFINEMKMREVSNPLIENLDGRKINVGTYGRVKNFLNKTQVGQR